MLDERRLFTVAQTPRQPLHRRLSGVALALARCDRRVGRLHRQLGRLVVVAILAADGVLELAQTASHRAADLREAFRAEEQQPQQEQEDDIPRAYVGHEVRVAGLAGKVGETRSRWRRSGFRSRWSSSAAGRTAWAGQSPPRRPGAA